MGAYVEVDEIRSKWEAVKENPDVTAAMESLTETLGRLLEQLDDSLNELQNKQERSEQHESKIPLLNSPTHQKFSVYNTELGQSKDEVEQRLGEPKRVSENEYGVNWYSYHEDYHNFLMVSYDENNRVNGLYTNQDLISSSAKVQLGSSKESVKNYLGEPLTQMRKGLVYYQVQNHDEYEIFQIDNSYITVFYDLHENDTVTAIQIISAELEKNKKSIYTMSSPELKEGFEYQLFDLTNAARVNHGLGILTWDDHVKETARKHSLDMAENRYFDHVNLQGKSPFDRMKDDQISFLSRGKLSIWPI
ncbi:CAP domain-containing protein [Bacillus sp. N9]